MGIDEIQDADFNYQLLDPTTDTDLMDEKDISSTDEFSSLPTSESTGKKITDDLVGDMIQYLEPLSREKKTEDHRRI